VQASRYRIARLLERGGTAEVFEAFIVGERGFERRVALKRLREDIVPEDSFVDHFVDEARIAAQLQHANVVSVFDFGVMDGLPFMVLEYVDGFDLRKLVERQGNVSPDLALAVTLEIARALAYAHKAKDAKGTPLRIVHRDVSPSNVLLSFAGEVKLSDFGIALAMERSAQTAVGSAKGKLSFMSPEQMNGNAVDARADVYSLGLLLHFMLTGSSPLDREDARDKVRRGGDCTISQKIDRDLAAIIQRATKTDPERRHRSADDLAAEVTSTMSKRSIDRDTRALLEEFMGKLAPRPDPQQRTPLVEMMDVELVMSDGAEPLRRFESIAIEGRTALADRQEKTETTLDRLLGTVLHGYRLVEVIGKGSVARVYRAKHLVLDREYAVKVLNMRSGVGERGRVRLEREAQALSKLQHPNIVQAFDFGATEDGRPFLTMELLQGQTLKTIIMDEGPLEPMRAGAIARQIAMGLDAAHRAGFVHRDLKPSNVILVEEDGRDVAKVLDFGIARAESYGTRITASDQLLGTPRYMAPEQIRGASNVGPQADLYALGAVLYAMLTGQPPFVGTTIEVVEKQLTEKPKPLETGTRLDELTQWLLAKAPEERPTSADKVVRWLEEAGYREDVTRTAILPERTELLVRPERTTSPLMVGGIIALLIAVVALAGALWWPKPPEPVRVRSEPPPPIAEKAPEVIARPQADERTPPPPPPPEPEPETADNPPPKKAPKNKKDPQENLQPLVQASMRKRGLSRRDVMATPQLQPLLQKYEADEDTEAANAFIQALERFIVDDAIVKVKLDRVAKSLASLAGKRDQSKLDQLENRYLDLRSSFRPGLSGSELSALMIRIDQLEREL
jgi:eukaryotic-like serine/threonine-protein kinase